MMTAAAAGLVVAAAAVSVAVSVPVMAAVMAAVREHRAFVMNTATQAQKTLLDERGLCLCSPQSRSTPGRAGF